MWKGFGTRPLLNLLGQSKDVCGLPKMTSENPAQVRARA